MSFSFTGKLDLGVNYIHGGKKNMRVISGMNEIGWYIDSLALAWCTDRLTLIG